MQTPVIIEDYAGECLSHSYLPCPSICHKSNQELLSWTDAFKGMTVENIIDVCGDREVSVARRDSEKGKWANIEWYKYGMLRRAIKHIADHSNHVQNVTSSLVGVFDWSLQKYCAELLDSYFVVPKYIGQDFLQRVPHDKELNYRDYWPSLFV